VLTENGFKVFIDIPNKYGVKEEKSTTPQPLPPKPVVIQNESAAKVKLFENTFKRKLDLAKNEALRGLMSNQDVNRVAAYVAQNNEFNRMNFGE
jgi:hypothetical protein